MLTKRQPVGKTIHSPSLRKGWGVLVFFLLFIVSCTSIDCPIQNTVYTVYTVNGTVGDTLSVSIHQATGKDTIVYNRGINPTSFNLPISYQRAVDTLFFYFYGKNVTDTVCVSKTDIPHFESVDCGASFFHTLNGVTTTHHAIADIVITNPTVDYDSSNPHFLITFQ